MNVIYGENAQGKTNLLEGIFLLSTLRSFRTRHLPEALQFGQPDAWIQGSVERGHSKHFLAVSFTDNAKVATLDRKKVDALQYLGIFDVFLFSFPLLEIIRGGPEERRRFLDRAIAISKPGYLSILLQLHRVIKQKNALLNGLLRGHCSRKEGIEEIRSFNLQLLEQGQEIAKQRLAYLSRLKKLLPEKQELFFEKHHSLSIELQSSFLATPEQLHEKLETVLEREIARGFCLLGVHRDEIVMTLNGRELRKYGSSGQHRAFLLLVLLAQLDLYEEWREDRPVLLLDDLDSEMDQGRIHAFLNSVRDRYQTFISTSRRELFSKNGSSHFLEIESGRLLEKDNAGSNPQK